MKINRVVLENYRIHNNLVLEFSSGINLLLGKNGKGKSSILEAIGYALFDSELRTKNQREAISFGKKSAKIEIDFTGIDNREYKVVRKIPGSTVLYDLENDAILENKSTKIKELCGIRGDIKGIYDNVIVAKQNEFISIFKESPNEREKAFNKIFNTDIYLKIYEGYSREIASKYERELEIEKNSISSISEFISNYDELKSQLEITNEQYEISNNHMENMRKNLNFLSLELNKIKNLEEEITKFSSSLLLKEKDKKHFEENLTNIKNQIILGEKAIEDNNTIKDQYNKYLEFYEKKSKLNQEIEILESKIIEYQNKEKEKLEFEKKKESFLNKIQISQNNIQNFSKIITEKNKELKEFQKDKENDNKTIEQYKTQLENLKPLIIAFDDFENKLNEGKKLIDSKILSINELNSSIKELENEIIKIEKADVNSKINRLFEIEKIKNQMEIENGTIKTQIENNNLALKELSSSFCPYLKEKCENLKGVEVEKFFTDKNSTLIEKFNKNKANILKFSQEIEELNSFKNLEVKYQTFVNELKNKKNTLENEKLKKENWELRYNLKEREFQEFKNKTFILSKEELNEKKISLEFGIKNILEKKIDNKISSLSQNIEEIKNNINIIHNEVENHKLQVKNIGEEIINIQKFLTDNNHYLQENTQKKSELSSIEKELEILIKVRDRFLANTKLIENMELNLKDEKNILESISSLENEIECLNTNKNSLKKQLEQFDKEKIATDEKNSRLEIEELSEKLGVLKEQINTLHSRIKECEKYQSIISEKNKNINLLENKIKLTKIFRDNIKSMGKEVSKHMLKEIEILATDNFRKITNRTDRIIWSNDDKDKYSVYLFGDRGELKFEQLSGGEQVALAISIRSAMSELFTESKFSIFDEPTNNLDVERRKSLADSIGEILNNLEQSIIVTHDDTFREMAQKVIEL